MGYGSMKYSDKTVGYMDQLAQMPSYQSSPNRSVPTNSGSSSTIQQEEVEVADSGGGGGMSQMSAFVDLGDKLHKNTISSIQLFNQLANQRRDRRRQKMMDAEEKRRFDENMSLSTRGQNMDSLNYLAQMRSGAGAKAGAMLPFRMG